MYYAYSGLLALGILLALPLYLWKGRRSGKYFRTFRERMGRLPDGLRAGPGPSIWIHAVSVGEVLAARLLVPALKARLPHHAIYLSTTTETGQAVARQSVRGADGVFFAPFDWPGPVRIALARLDPVLLVLVETELWPNLIHEARRHRTRVAVVNGRISPRSFPRYRRIRFLFENVLREVDLFLMQSEPHAERMRAIGAPGDRVRVAGNLKFDALDGLAPTGGLPSLVSAGGPLWVAGSTVAGEEEMVLRAFAALRERVPALRLLIAPRHPERFDTVPPLAESLGLGCRRRSALAGPWVDSPVLLLDTIGELAQVYPAAEVVFVGGSLVEAGGHNVLEPAVAGKAVVVGPHMENFQEIADELLAEKALVQVRDPQALAAQVLRLLEDPAARQAQGARARAVVDRNRGALDRTADALAGLLA